MRQIQPRQNYLGAGGWVWGGKYGLERYLYLLHRITGLGLILFGMLHLIETTIFRMQGQDMWESTMSFLAHPVFEVGLYIVVIAFIFHALNGLRLFLQEIGLAIGKAQRPVFPLKHTLKKKRPVAIVMIVVMVALAVVFLVDFII